ncbi:MAG: hydrogenase maturation protease [Actinomycetota bacterium]|nr:hydrogenase maturation protease [Actinomycetota bacterium]
MRALVAGLGNIFEGDDGFGVEVAQALSSTQWPAGVELRDYGIRGVHLAYQLLDAYDLVVIIDAVQRGGEPGTIYVMEHAADATAPAPAQDAPILDAHDLAPDGVLALVPMLGGTLGRVMVIGCEPATIMPALGLSRAVAGSVEKAAQIVTEIVLNAYAGAEAPADEIRVGGV